MLGLLLLLVLRGAAGAPDPSIEETIPCATCAGTGRAEEACWVCLGAGAHACVACRGFSRTPSDGRADLWPFRDDGAAIVAPVIRLPGVGPEPAEIGPGERACAARCVGGELPLGARWVDCKLCRGGKVRCEACDRGSVACARCEGDGRAIDACRDCAGNGAIPARAAADPAVCPWCGDAKLRACGACDERGLADLGCVRCYGAARVPCETCEGLERFACDACGGRGKGERGACASCKGKGAFECRACAAGWTACAACAGGAPRVGCPDCQGAKRALCAGCESDGYEAWERTAARLLAGGDPAAAVWFQETIVLCERRYERGARQLEGADLDELARELRKEGAREVRRLDGLRKQAERAAAEAKDAKDAKDADLGPGAHGADGIAIRGLRPEERGARPRTRAAPRPDAPPGEFARQGDAIRPGPRRRLLVAVDPAGARVCFGEVAHVPADHGP